MGHYDPGVMSISKVNRMAKQIRAEQMTEHVAEE